MFVNRSMTRKVVTVGRDAGIFEARNKMKENDIRHLPVIEKDGTLIGIVTDRDIRSAMSSEAYYDIGSKEIKERVDVLCVGDIMTPNPICVSPTHTIQDAILLIQRNKVGALPVVDEKRVLKGIISIRDLLRAFINVLGIGEPGTLLCILVEEKVGQLKKIVDAITEENISFGSILVARYWEEGKRAVFPYLLTQNIGPVKRKLKKLGFELLDPMEWYLDQLPKTEDNESSEAS